ncbi:helix-turn-helix domain-containing protein [Gillisia sp. M10.2A]|uniref:Helix-turn-helix domain-containing protein n=1 Tax=Gillisia lutea TaxID=2909668 RepID=A0ABS9EGT5_9FLAO|nr:helix-turn-helix domain-containing protein [Gillisia lutea]MCF4101039.1 helix-turn-helix domain-containing protein [Gillisia lutea]
MDNPFEIILSKLESIEKQLEELKKIKSKKLNDELMTIEEIADYINYQKSSIYGLVKKRKIPFIKASGKLHFRKSEIDNWLNRGKIKSRAEIKKMADMYILKNPLP